MKRSGLGALGAIFSAPVLLAVGGGALLLALGKKKKPEALDPCAGAYTPDIKQGSCKPDEQTEECVCTLTDAAQGRQDAQSIFFYDSAGTVAWDAAELKTYSESACAKSADSLACTASRAALAALPKDDGAVGAPLRPLAPIVRERLPFNPARIALIMQSAPSMPAAYQATYQTTFLSLVDGLGAASPAVRVLNRLCGVNPSSFECTAVTARWNKLK
jgi:hypothetical protein